VNLDVVCLRKPVLDQELLHFDTLVALELKNVTSVTSVSNNGTVAAVSLHCM
jgi:hypothetical protein